MFAKPRAAAGWPRRYWRIEREARDSGLVLLRLETGTRQTAALTFYRRAGFQPCAAFGAYATMAAPAIATSVFLEKPLGG